MNSAITIAIILFCAISYFLEFESLVFLSAINTVVRFMKPNPTPIILLVMIFIIAAHILSPSLSQLRLDIRLNCPEKKPHGNPVRLALQAQDLPLSNYILIRPFFQSEHMWATRTCSLLMRTQVVKLIFYSKEAFFTPNFTPICL